MRRKLKKYQSRHCGTNNLKNGKLLIHSRGMNRALRKQHMRRFSLRGALRGGGYGMGAPIVPINASDDWSFSIKAPINQSFNDCAIPDRSGQIHNQANHALAQAAWPLTGGKRRRTGRKHHGGNGCMRRRRTMRGGGNGFGINPAISVGGSGPNVGALVVPVPCDARAGSPNPLNPITGMSPDPRAPTDLYSLTPNQTGGAYSSGNGYSDDCYKAPGSSLPVYPTETAGFTFRPSTEVGGTLPDGVTAYMNVTPYAARMGGARRKSRRHRRKQRKSTHRRRRTHH
jgi:hypothetical protein